MNTILQLVEQMLNLYRCYKFTKYGDNLCYI